MTAVFRTIGRYSFHYICLNGTVVYINEIRSKFLQLGLWSAHQTNSNNSTLKMGFTDTTTQRSIQNGVQTISNDSSTLPNELWLRYSTLYEDNYTFTLFSVGCIVGLLRAQPRTKLYQNKYLRLPYETYLYST